MTTINEIQLIIQNLLKRTVSQQEIGNALGTGRSNINLRIKNKSEIKINEIQKLENFFNIKLIDSYQSLPEKQNIYYKQSLQILNNANEKELEFYYGLLKQGQIGIKIIKNCF